MFLVWALLASSITHWWSRSDTLRDDWRISARDQMWVTDMNGLLDGLFYVTVYFQ
jgi:hypothetical protein